MKKRLLKPPENNGQLLILPDIKELLSYINEDSRIGVCHQPYFFNPGVGLKYIFLERLPKGVKRIIFLDTDIVNIQLNLPCQEGSIKTEILINTDSVLYDYPTPGEDIFYDFFSSVEDKIKKTTGLDFGDAISNLSIFKDIIFKNIDKRFLKEVLAESFLEFYDIRRDYYFLSDLIRGKEFKEFFFKIYNEATLFKGVFNSVLDEYRKEFRFRYKNFPFPKLEENELPFWVVKERKRIGCFKDDLDVADIDRSIIFPRAATLTIFLRLYRLDFFIHGIGGANYEWVQDRIIERFFKKTPPPFAVVSGTFLIDNIKQRDFPYFLYSPQEIVNRLQSYHTLFI